MYDVTYACFTWITGIKTLFEDKRGRYLLENTTL